MQIAKDAYWGGPLPLALSTLAVLMICPLDCRLSGKDNDGRPRGPRLVHLWRMKNRAVEFERTSRNGPGRGTDGNDVRRHVLKSI